jgi:predicted porin
MSGFTGSIQYSAGEGTFKSNAGIWSLGGFYANGPAQFGIAYNQNNSIRGVGLTDQAFSIAGAWNFGAFKLSGVWERLDYDYTTSTNLKRDFWQIGATINLGPGQMYASYGMAYDGEGSAPDTAKIGNLVHGSNTGANHWTITYTYPWSKRTLSYVGYARVDNDSRAAYTFNVNSYAVAPGGNPQGFVLGTVHFF